MQKTNIIRSIAVILTITSAAFFNQLFINQIEAQSASSSSEAQSVCPEGDGWVKIDSWSTDATSYTYTAPNPNNIISEICIKGSNDIAYFTTDGTQYCWIASGIGTNSATASEDVANWQEGGVCHDISHASFKEIPAPSSTPTPTPTVPVTTATPTIEPTHSPDPTATPTKKPSSNETDDNSSDDSSEEDKTEDEKKRRRSTWSLFNRHGAWSHNLCQYRHSFR